MWLILALLVVFISVSVYPGSCARGFIVVGEQQRNLSFPFSIDPWAHYARWVLTGHNWNHIYKLFVFYFHHPCPFFPWHNLSLQVLCCFHFSQFYFRYNFVVFKEMSHSLLFPGVMTWRDIHTENSVIREINLKEHKPLFWVSVNLSDIFKIRMKQDNQSFFVTMSRGEKDGAQPIISLVVYFIMVGVSSS